MSLYRTTFYSSETTHLFSDPYFIVSMLKAESALAQAQAKTKSSRLPLQRLSPGSMWHDTSYQPGSLIQEIPLGGNAAILW